ncbi:DsrH/TusB family sulfur relay protein [Acinetobacter pittii]|uniref:DsrH like protein n=1 Tax=Acinetobacter pittii TaxID=48296 RepID=A0AAE8GAK3_ACIPI|nr:DsrH like protein [Acinetobacter pittii]MCU4431542.1 DsrH/TusB family sulfur relay protein [Acinetobacter pittii]MCU4533307.1 DsrH/TusB family sulfur relay protein [Acinetobacter pittii]ODI91849.1 DsrH like protein [Acinetobacter pittii]RZH31989.1 DsrH like protein [Acinetobacter pittii]WGM26217.1 DsrH/TusB family sulfur relay protein [Acinetobacter pittii]
MNPSTLYLVQSSYHATPKIIDELSHLFQIGDQVVFMGDSVAHISTEMIQPFESVSCLSIEKDLLDTDTLSQVKVLDYDQFADLVLTFNRCISLK